MCFVWRERRGNNSRRKAWLSLGVNDDPLTLHEKIPSQRLVHRGVDSRLRAWSEPALRLPVLLHKKAPSQRLSQTTDKARNRKNADRKNEIGWHFCLLRQLRLQISVTYVCVCAFICSLASLSCRLFQRLQIADFVNDLTQSKTECLWLIRLILIQWTMHQRVYKGRCIAPYSWI